MLFLMKVKARDSRYCCTHAVHRQLSCAILCLMREQMGRVRIRQSSHEIATLAQSFAWIELHCKPKWLPLKIGCMTGCALGPFRNAALLDTAVTLHSVTLPVTVTLHSPSTRNTIWLFENVIFIRTVLNDQCQHVSCSSVILWPIKMAVQLL